MEQWGVYAVTGSASGSGTMRNLHVSGEMPWGTNSCVSDYCLFLIPTYIYIYLYIINILCLFGLDWKRTPHPSEIVCPQSSWPMILLQQAGLLSHPEKPSSLPMSVATRPRATSPLSPPKSLGLGPSFYHAQDEELAKVVEQDPMLEELCKPLCCKLCNVTLNSAQQAQAHYQVSRVAEGTDFRAAASALGFECCVEVATR